MDKPILCLDFDGVIAGHRDAESIPTMEQARAACLIADQ